MAQICDKCGVTRVDGYGNVTCDCKRNRIREGIERKIQLGVDFGFTPAEIAKEVMEYEDSQNVVIKVDRELPRLKSLTGEATIEEKSAFLLGLKYAQEGIIEVGYVAVESLIEG